MRVIGRRSDSEGNALSLPCDRLVTKSQRTADAQLCSLRLSVFARNKEAVPFAPVILDS
ncbi:MAG: hypothetical protein KF784_11765 [Fimbriimonadaceae bacterium]|nr:hypothetical protein [Fimbriimonadaceae bacterium]